MPEFSASAEAWLEVWSYGVPELPDVLLDITVRYHRAERYQPGAARCSGYAAAQAEVEKETKYQAAGRRSLWPIAHETWGRLGHHAEQLLLTCSAVASRRAYRRGRAPGNCLRRGRAQLDGALHRSIALELASASV